MAERATGRKVVRSLLKLGAEKSQVRPVCSEGGVLSGASQSQELS